MRKFFIVFNLMIVISTNALSESFIRGHNICGRDVALYRKHHGLSIPRFPALAANWLTLRRVANRVGAVMVVARGHGRYHVADALGNGMCLNPSSRKQAWIKMPCNSIWRNHWRVYVN